MNLQKVSYYFVASALSAIVLFGYQNCSQTHFSSDLDGMSLKAADVTDATTPGDDGQVAGVPSVPASSPTPAPSVSPVPSATPMPSASPSMDDSKGDKKGDCKNDQGQGEKNPKSSSDADGEKVPKAPNGKDKKDDAAVAGLVECQMLSPSKKVVLSYDLESQHGNSSSVRVCMSENACLKLVNAFAIKHSCSLDASAPAAQADAQSQCTEIFPGSKGTCHNAAVLSDAQVDALIKKMEASK